jgi:hypothetical protein
MEIPKSCSSNVLHGWEIAGQAMSLCLEANETRRMQTTGRLRFERLQRR